MVMISITIYKHMYNTLIFYKDIMAPTCSIGKKNQNFVVENRKFSTENIEQKMREK